MKHRKVKHDAGTPTGWVAIRSNGYNWGYDVAQVKDFAGMVLNAADYVGDINQIACGDLDEAKACWCAGFDAGVKAARDR